MIQAHAFLAVFAVQVFTASVLFPSRLIRYTLGWARDFGSERFAQLFPGSSYETVVARLVTGYRIANVLIAALGIVLLGWMFLLIPHADWPRKVSNLAMIYFFVQFSPLVLITVVALARSYKLLLQPPQEPRRSATLQRRGLFDFVSPLTVAIVLLSYPAYVAYSLWLDLHVYANASPSRYFYQGLAAVTLVYALNAFVIYRHLYGRKNPFVSREGRWHLIGARIKGAVYGSIAVAWFMSMFGTLGQPGLQDWRPFALTTFFVIATLLCLVDLDSPSWRKHGALKGEVSGT